MGVKKEAEFVERRNVVYKVILFLAAVRDNERFTRICLASDCLSPDL